MSGRPASDAVGQVRARPAMVLPALLPLCVLLAGVARAQPAAVPVDVEAHLATAERYAAQIDQMRFAGDTDTPAVGQLLKQGLAALDQAEALLAEQDQEPPATEDAQLQVRRCRVAFARGELLRRAAAVLPRAAPDRAGYLDQAIAVFQAMRLDYRQLAVGRLGYIGEARARRLMDDPVKAYVALRPVLDLTKRPQDATAIELRRLALLERLETDLASDHTTVAVEAGKVPGTEPVFSNAPRWRASIAWVVARAAAAEVRRQARTRPGAADLAAAVRDVATRVREPSLADEVAEPDRLSVLAQLDALVPDPVMTATEQLAWAGVLAGAGRHDEARGYYERGLAAAGAAATVESLVAYGTFLWQQGDPAVAAEVFARALEQDATLDGNERIKLLHWRAACWVDAVARAPGGMDDQPLIDRTLAAAWDVIQSAAPVEARADMLRHWVSLQSRRAGAAACRDALHAHSDLVGNDPHLRYMRAVADWQHLHADLDPSGDVPADALPVARQIIADLEAAQAAALAQPDTELVALSALLRAQVLAARPLGDPQGALRVLGRAGHALEAITATRAPAAQLRIALLLQLGMVDGALEALAAELSGGRASAELVLQAAEALAQRYANADAATRGQLQATVIGLTNRTLMYAIRAGVNGEDLGLRPIKALLAVEAYADARQMLDPVMSSLRWDAESPRAVEAALLHAQALIGQGAVDEAAAALELVVQRDAESAELRLALARCRAEQGRSGVALARFRQARRLATPGSDLWWQATLGVVASLHATRKQSRAHDVLRTAVALYRPPQATALWKELQRLQRLVKPALPPTPVDSTQGVP